MKTVKHTGAPWVVRWRNDRLTTVIGRQRFPICDTGTSPPGQANPRREEANAFLISAAPDLLVCLTEIVVGMSGYAAAGSRAEQSFDRARAAIAKAHGAAR
jgi:hypothetical protein